MLLSPQAWQLEHPIQSQVLLDQLHELHRHLILTLQVGAPSKPTREGGGAVSRGLGTLLIAVSHSGAMEENVVGSVLQKLEEDGQALNQLRLLGQLNPILSLLLNEELEQGGQLTSHLRSSSSKHVLLLRRELPVVLLPLSLAREGFVGASSLLWISQVFDGLQVAEGSRGMDSRHQRWLSEQLLQGHGLLEERCADDILVFAKHLCVWTL